MVFRTKTIILCFVLFLFLSVTSYAATNVGGPIRQDTTWTADGSPYIVIQSVSVNEGCTLTIMPGVRVEFKAALGFFIDGQIVAKGTPGNPIVFTSALSSPTSRAWNGFEFSEISKGGAYNESGEYLNGSIFEHANIEYASTAIFANNVAPHLSNVTLQHSSMALSCVNASVNIKGSSFINNTNSGFGGAIYSDSSSLTITDCSFNNNTATRGGAIYSVANKTPLKISRCTFSGNTSSGRDTYGGAIYAHSTTTGEPLIITDCSFSGNTSSGQAYGEVYGGAICFGASNSRHNPTQTIIGCSFTENTSEEGAAIYSEYCPLIISDSTFSGNIGTEKGNKGSGAICSDSSLTISGCSFNNNVANEQGGAIYAGSSLTIADCSFSGNTSSDFGGAIYSPCCSVIISDSVFNKNITETRGAAICFVSGHLTITNCSFTENASNRCYGEEYGGSVIYTGSTKFEMSNSLISQNRVSVAISLLTGTFIRCTIVNNGCGGAAGKGIYVKKSLTISDSNIFGHKDYNIKTSLYDSETSIATGNYWGTANEMTILLNIFDKLDDARRGEVVSYPFLESVASGPSPPPQIDTDGDGVLDDIDNCPSTSNPDQLDTNGDGVGDICDQSGNDEDGDGYTKTQGDCDDNDNTIFPDAIEICGDGIDQNCDGKDEACLEDSTPSAPTGVNASDGTSSNRVQVIWSSASGATSYDVYRADMPAWTGTSPKRIASFVSETSYDDTSAVGGSRYYYWVKARNSGGVSKYSNFDAGYWGSTGTIPAVPTNVSATDDTVSGKVNITWDATANTLVYEIWRADIPAFLGGKLKKVGTSATTSYSDATVVNGNRYYYWVKARNSWGVSRYSKFDTGYIGSASSPLPAPTGVSATDGTVSGKVDITWNVTSGAVVYEVWRATDLVSAGGKPVRVGFTSSTSLSGTSGSPGTTYYYWVKSRNSWGASKYSVPDTGYCSSNNELSVVDAGPDQTVSYGETVILDGTGSNDPAIVSYQWIILKGTFMPELLNKNTVVSSFVAPNVDCWVELQLQVTNNNGQVRTDNVRIIVSHNG